MGQKQKSNNTAFKKVVDGIFSLLSGDQKIEILKKHLSEDLIDVFEDKELIFSVESFLKNNLNVSETSRNAFMHRNTLLYRIEKIHRLTKFNIRNFEDAVAVKLLYIIYKECYRKL